MKIPAVCLCSGQRRKFLKKTRLQQLNLTPFSLTGLKGIMDDRYGLSAASTCTRRTASMDKTPAAFVALLLTAGT